MCVCVCEAGGVVKHEMIFLLAHIFTHWEKRGDIFRHGIWTTNLKNIE